MAAKRTPLEVFKFSLYLILPVCTIAVFNQPKMIEKLIKTREYIVYPPEAERPPIGQKEAIEQERETNRQDGGEATPLEVFKFSLYLILPVCTIAVFNQPKMIEKLIKTREYIVYPPEAERPPIGQKEAIEQRIMEAREAKASNGTPSEAAGAETQQAPGSSGGWFSGFFSK
eukprot:CAMPEP_0184532158 /NCGR_PEP_ID=MMETSP0198_2-20121128/13997_1 /TAXON_ID=1112570 /ORGANISM="Thraustochytrium sp., Strain LLF1b" /LENGTH=171 /DNA_ID=CAMNT_0026924695 /DNA_START=51 /DNA_END=567 /DNA_ORIENTATION=+